MRTLQQHFPGIWALCLEGALDTYKASLVAETAKFSLARASDFARFAERLTAWLSRSIPSDDPERPRLVNRTVKQLRNKISYELKKLKPREADERFRRAFPDRSARVQLDEDGMGCLLIDHTVTDVQLADYRLTLIAKTLRAQGDERTLEQLRADLAIDLITGRVAVAATIAELEDEDATPPGCAATVRRLPASSHARPIINVTVPIQTLMGVSDHPGMLSGGTAIPASLARMIAADPDSTWYRMLTDEHGQMQELSTQAYRPSPPIWRAVIARYNTCYRPHCTRPATACEIDHLHKWPEGPTSTSNLGPVCHADHMGKHSPGVHLDENTDGTLTFHTRAGFSHTTEHTPQPSTCHWTDTELLESQYSATEILDAVRYLRAQDEVIEASLATHLDEDDRWLLHPAA